MTTSRPLMNERITAETPPEVPPIAWRTGNPMETPQAALMQLLIGYWISQPIYIAAKLGIADLLRDGPRSTDELARATDAHAESLYRILRASAAMGIFAETENSRFENTPMSQLLRSDIPGSLRGWALWSGDPWHWRAWGALMHTVKSGERAFDHVHGKTFWEYLAEDPEAADTFNGAMSGNAVQQWGAVIPAYDFSRIETLVDVGGGEGQLLATILQENPRLRGVVFDQPSVVERAAMRLEQLGLSDRCETAAGDFFDAVPAGADGYILTAIIHDWDDESARRILANVRQAIAPGGKLLVIELVVPPGNEFGFAKFADIEQLTCFAGKERTAEEYRELLASAGFALKRILPTAGPASVIEGEPD